MLEIRHLKTISALRDTGSLVEAAERLHLTQSALSHQIKDLEERLGCEIYVRKTRPPRFTSAGMRLLSLADQILPMMRMAQRDINRLEQGEAGRLFICIECHSCFQWLIPSIDNYRNAWPDIELDLTGGFNFEPLPALAKGDLDIVITSDPVDIAGIVYVPLFRYEALLAMSRNHPLAGKMRIYPEDLKEQILITYPVDRNRLDIFTRFLDPVDLEPAAVRNAELTPMMVQLVASGRGVACLPNWALTEYMERQTVIARPLGDKGLWATLYAAVREDQRQAPFMADFILTAIETSFEHLVGIKQPAVQSLDDKVL